MWLVTSLKKELGEGFKRFEGEPQIRSQKFYQETFQDCR